MMDGNLERPPIVGGASVYPFCWSVLLAARARGLGGVHDHVPVAQRAAAAPLLGLPDGSRAGGDDLPRPRRAPSDEAAPPRRSPTFATIDRFDGTPLA